MLFYICGMIQVLKCVHLYTSRVFFCYYYYFTVRGSKTISVPNEFLQSVTRQMHALQTAAEETDH